MLITVTLIFTPFLIPIQFIEYFFDLYVKGEVTVIDGLDVRADPGPLKSMAALYVRIVSPAIIVFCWSNCYNNFSAFHGKPQYAMYSTSISSFVHLFLAYYLAVYLDMKMIGVAIASNIHFCCRFAIGYFFASRDKDL